MMKKLFAVLIAIVAFVTFSSFVVSNLYVNDVEFEEKGNDYVFFTNVTGWSSATDSDTYPIYYKEGNGERMYYFGSYHYSIYDNEFFNSPVCDDFRKNYRYVSGEIYFNCSLPGRVEEIVDGYRFHTQVKGWCNATDSDIYSIYYKEGNGEREYYFGCYHYSIHDNEKYNSPNCNDFRKKYKYVSDGRYFNCNLPGRR